MRLFSVSGGPPTVEEVVVLDFDSLVYYGKALPNYYLTSATVDNHGLLWVLDSHNSIVYKFYLNTVVTPKRLEFIGSWGGFGVGDGQLSHPKAIAAQHGIRIDRCGGLPNCAIRYYLTNLHDILITETWGPTTGIRRFSIGVEAFVDSSKYVAKSSTGGGNFVDWWHHFTDYVNVTEKVYRMPQNTLVATVTNNLEMPPRSTCFGRWDVGTNDSGTYRIELTANSLYGDATDVKNFTVFVDTTRRNNAPSVTQNPYYAHPEWTCFFPPDAGIGLGPENYGGDFVKVAATDPDGDQLTYNWRVDTTLGFVGRDSRQVEYTPPGTISSYSTFADSVFYAVPTSYRARYTSAPLGPPTNCEEIQCLEVQITDPAGNWVEKQGVGLKSHCKRGDLDASGLFSISDVVVLLNLAFFGNFTANPRPYGDYSIIADVNCSGQVTAGDVVLLLNMTFLGHLAPC